MKLDPWPYPRWVAHRGAGKLAPENTLAAFRLGGQYGYRMFECDVKLSADGVPFLMHDAELERTTDGHGVAGEQSWHALSLRDAGSWHSRAFAGEPLPSFERIARHCLANGHALNIEIKPTPGVELLTGEAVAEVAARLWSQASVPPLLTSFRPESLWGAKNKAAHLPRGLLLDTLWDGWFEVATQLEVCAIVCNQKLWDAALVERVHAAGWRALSYTVNEADMAQRLTALGVDGLITDRVDLFSPAH